MHDQGDGYRTLKQVKTVPLGNLGVVRRVYDSRYGTGYLSQLHYLFEDVQKDFPELTDNDPQVFIYSSHYGRRIIRLEFLIKKDWIIPKDYQYISKRK